MNWTRWLRLQWDRCAAWLCIAAGGVLLLLGWLGVSKTAYPAEQISYLASGGLAGIFLLGLGATLWLSADLRDQWFKLDRIESKMGRGDADGDPSPSKAAEPERNNGRPRGAGDRRSEKV